MAAWVPIGTWGITSRDKIRTDLACDLFKCRTRALLVRGLGRVVKQLPQSLSRCFPRSEVLSR